MNTPAHKDEFSDAYLGKRLAWAKERLARLEPEYRFKWDIYFERLEDLARDARRFLDAGCGNNKTATELAGPDLCAGVDLVLHDPTGGAVRAALERLPFAPSSFDLVGCRYVAEHLTDPAAVFAELHRVMAPGGKLLIQTVNRQSLMIRLSRLLGGLLRRRISVHRYARHERDVFPVRDLCNTPEFFERPPAGFRFVRIWLTQDVDVQSRFGFWLTYRLVRWTRKRPRRRSTITALWERI